EQKGIWEILYAAKTLLEKRSDFKIYLVGKGNQKEINIYKNFISENNLNNNIEFVGLVKNELVKYYFKIAEFSILPSYSEGLPLVILESLATGVPAIATNVGGIPEIIKDNSLGKLINPKSTVELSNAILEFLDNKIVNIDYKAIEKFNIEYQAKKTLELYNQLI
ncbi:MAG TPA: glycosyltransferase family 4 protein, partial [Spirochaetota bacterium]|nr:glycosyltransferase family 4 protein [Spirochaetota bacterium]